MDLQGSMIGGAQTDCSGTWYGQVVGTYECGNEPSGSRECGGDLL